MASMASATLNLTFDTIVPLVERPHGSYVMVNAVDPLDAVIVSRWKDGKARSRWFANKMRPAKKPVAVVEPVGENP